tara:strand:- start:3248 stop:3538 length:291 start_codon:yes stop_codon:yes gene_type:complete
MRQNQFYIIDDDKNIIETVSAFCKRMVHRPDGKSYWCLEHIDGILDNNRFFNENQDIQMVDCYLDPNAPPGKIREGCEEEFEFFLKNGYHMSKSNT